MSKVHVLNRPEDYNRFHLNPNEVQLFEDSRRGKKIPGMMENWYFDAILDDGSKVVLSFRPKSPVDIMEEGDSPNLNIHVTTPEGETFTSMLMIPESEVQTGDDGNGADLIYGPHSLKGDLKDYDIHVEPVEGVGCDIHFHALVKPFRPGTGYVGFETEGKEVATYTWFCIPKGTVTGTLTANGKTWEVKGMGYRDHQWPDKQPMALWHHWLWGRSNKADYTLVIFDLVANEKFDYQWVPIMGILDPSGNVIFENNDASTASVEVLERYQQEESEKITPKKIHYHYTQGSDEVDLIITWIDELEVRASDNLLLQVDEENQVNAAKMMKKLGIDNPSYIRYLAQADLDFTIDGKYVTQSADMIYEFAYFGEFTEKALL